MPDRIRVHALAKLIGVTSKQVLQALSGLGAEARSAHSSLNRDVAESVRDALVKPADEAERSVAAEASPVEAPPVEAPTAEASPVEASQQPPEEPGLFTSAHTEAEPAPTYDAPAAEVQAPLFLPPDAEAIAEARRRQRAERAAQAEAEKQQAEAEKQAETADKSAVAEESAADEGAATEDSGESEGEAQPRRRRRGRRGRGRGRGEQSGNDSADESAADESDTNGDDETASAEEEASAESETDTDETTDTDDSDDSTSSTRRRRRRRRRKAGESNGDTDNADDDPPNTVVHEREPRNKNRARAAADEVQGISGSTRLEAKRQRRRDGRDAGRRRPPILTESEFLARRESVDRVMVVRDKSFPTDNGPSAHPITQVAVLEDKILVEHFVTSTASASMVGNVYLGRVQNVLPSMEAAFVDIGRGRNGVLYAGEVNWEAAGLGGKERKIEQALKPGDMVLVQVSKDPVGHKGARLTTQVSLAGRFLVYVPGGSSTGISRKLPDTERKRLKEILRKIVPADAGVIIRTASEGVSEEELARDVERLQKQWHTIEEQVAAAEGKGSPLTLYEEPDLLVKVVRDLFNEDFSKLVIEGERAWNTVSNYIGKVAPDLLPRLEKYEPSGENAPDVFVTYRIDEQLAKALDRKVWLPSGGTLVIDRTEAMTVIDVNTGKFTGSGGNLEETVTRNNLEAAEEIVRQMRLRDIGGMIIVDFIDMVLESNRDLVLRRLTEALGRDRTRHQVSEVTSLGLVQMTRKKLGTGLVEAFSTSCEHCHGRGIIVHSYPVEGAAGEESGRSRPETSRKRRGRDRGATAESSTNGTQGAEVDASVKRAHPVALAMAAHLAEHEHHEHEVTESELPDAGATAAPAVAEAAPAVVAEPSMQPQPEPEPESAGVRTRARRRVARATAAPSGSADGGRIFVIPADGEAGQGTDFTHLEEIPAPPRPPRRRRAAGRPAGPPVDGVE
nr:translation initiation factor IF-2 N-terminal domain-containing protein [Skermania sp. ID1734]